MTYTLHSTNTTCAFVTTIRLFTLLFLPTCVLSAQTKPVEQVANAHQSQEFQTIAFFQKSNEQESTFNVPEELNNFEILDLQLTQLEALTKSAPEAMILDLPFSTSIIELELVKVDLFPNGFHVKEMPSGKMLDTRLAGTYYRGIVKDAEGSIASISVVNGEVFGLISAPNMGNLVLGKMKSEEAYLLYNDGDIADQFSYSCNSDTREVEVKAAAGVAERGDALCAGIWLDVGNDIVLDKGGVDAASAFIQGLFAQVALIYANEGINLFISGMNVWTTQEPFSNLGEYKDYSSENIWTGSLAHYINYAHGGGIAWVDALCSNEFGYGVSGITSTYCEAPTYCWSTYVIAHEIGHGFGSAHTHDCVWNGNNTPIDVCGFSSCDGETPPEGGTIMSYCYMTAVGVNLSLGFGEQPGNLIRTNLAASDCVVTCTTNDSQTLSAGQGNLLPNVNVLVFPNPASEQITVQLEDFDNTSISLELLDGTGRIVRTKHIRGLQNNTTMQVQNLNPGVYVLKLESTHGHQVTQKLILR